MLRATGKLVFEGATPPGEFGNGTWVAPTIAVLDSPAELTREVFGPVLHVVKWKAKDLDAVLDAIKATGFGLTLGVHSRIEATVRRVIDRLAVGNVYVNRNIIGAVRGSRAPDQRRAGRAISRASSRSRRSRSTPRRRGATPP
jgi:RHH-type proline utilization regulon transcriptional repressor/proline dehydrogenase/delta 1-pyrroline-5-carboxylate dehydrogenase